MRTRTSNLLIRSQMLYPIELWVLVPPFREAGMKAPPNRTRNSFVGKNFRPRRYRFSFAQR